MVEIGGDLSITYISAFFLRYWRKPEGSSVRRPMDRYFYPNLQIENRSGAALTVQ